MTLLNVLSINKSTIIQDAVRINKLITSFLWLFCIANIIFLFKYYPNLPVAYIGDYFRINGFTTLIWITVSFFGAIVSSYSEDYLKGFLFHKKFILLSLAFTLSVMLFVISNHVITLILSWFLMGLIMSRLIGVDSNWEDAKQASKFTQKYFSTSTIFLTIGLLLLAFTSNTLNVDSMLINLNNIPEYIILLSAFCIIISALIQSAIFPFHRWLLSSMTAPTPASALMHAGFVNGSGILLVLFSSVLFTTNTLDVLFVIGGITAILAQFTKLLQVNVKQKLACSTIAQMGFMIMQCGLGFFNAAIAHLILHGFYKAYLFLSAGEEIEFSEPKKKPQIRINPLQTILVLIYGLLGALLFTTLTGKGNALDSGLFLTLIVAITTGQLVYNIVKLKTLNILQKIIVPPILFFSGIILYALIYNFITALMAEMPMVIISTPISIIQMVFGAIFIIGFFVMKLGIYRQIPWLYVKLLNASQPFKKTILTNKTTTNVL
jgi:NAD(P)H-quinone oxidoreductase subunit 5